MSTNESGIEDDEYAAMYAKDRVDTLATTWLGLSVGCAACHNHRYDPQRLTFAQAGLPERLTGVGAPAKVVTDLINA